MESIASLLYNENYASREEIQNPEDWSETNQYHKFNFFGLFILKKLAKDPNNCVKIGETNDLIPKIIDFTTVIIPKLHHKNLIAHTDPEIQAAKRALKVLKRLASTNGRTGKTLRTEITKDNITIDNIHEILKHKGDDEILNPLRKLGVEIIIYLAMDEAGREIIGVREGMIRELVRIFLYCERLDGQVREKAGDALAMLVIESGENCERVRNAEHHVVSELLNEVGLLNEAGILKEAGLLYKAGKGLNSVVGQNALRILTYLFAYGDPSPNHTTRMELIIAVPRAVRFIMYGTEKQQEASTGFIVQIVKCKTKYEYFYEVSSVLLDRLPESLVNILQKYKYPSITTPSMRRNVIELSICLMQLNKECITKFRNYGMKKELKHVAKTTSDVECFVAFCGHVGIAMYGTAMTTLIDTARELLRKN